MPSALPGAWKKTACLPPWADMEVKAYVRCLLAADNFSLIFIIAIIIGYISGIVGKIVNQQFTYVVALYFINLIVVSIDLGLYFINARREKAVAA